MEIYWVVGPVTIVGIDPLSTDVDGHIMNGSMINPVSDDDQAYDSRSAGYNADKNVALDVDSGNPLVITAASSLISSISRAEALMMGSNPLWLDQIAVLTILEEAPPADSFRPPYSGSDKSIRHVEEDIDRTKLSNLPRPEGALSYDDLVTRVQMDKGPWIVHWDSWWETYVHPVNNMWWYGSGFAQRTGEAALALNLDYTAEEKEPILIDFLQMGIDFYGVIEAGDILNWKNNGGILHGRKIPVVFAAIVLQDAGMIAMLQKSGEYVCASVDENGYPNPTGPGNPPADYIYFQEDDQTFYVTQYDYDLTNDLVQDTPWKPDSRITQFPYRLTDIGMPGWGIRHSTEPETSARNLNTNYRSLNAATYPATALAAHIMGMKDEWNHDAFFDYTDRWKAWIWGEPPDPPEDDEVDETQELYDALKKTPAAWVWNAWFDYRDDYPPVWTNPSYNQAPIANAGSDQTVIDIDSDGNEQVTLNGSASYDSDGIIVSWVWTDDHGAPIPDGEITTATLSVDTHLITLTVTDNNDLSATDIVTITVDGEPKISSLETLFKNVIDISFVQVPWISH